MQTKMWRTVRTDGAGPRFCDWVDLKTVFEREFEISKFGAYSLPRMAEVDEAQHAKEDRFSEGGVGTWRWRAVLRAFHHLSGM